MKNLNDVLTMGFKVTYNDKMPIIIPAHIFKLAFLVAPQPLKTYDLLLQNPALTVQSRFLNDAFTEYFKNIENLKNYQPFIEQLNHISSHERKTLLKFILEKDDADDTFFALQPDLILNHEQAARFEQALIKLNNDYPLAYIIENQYFYGLKLKVTPDVLIPRPETELLVDKALFFLQQILKKKSKETDKTPIFLNILELGTGSGAISIALNHALKKIQPQLQLTNQAFEFKITAVDICPKALQIAKGNALHHQADITFLESNWFSALPKNKVDSNYHLIMTNPPYIAARDKHLQGSIRYEPIHALTDCPELVGKMNHSELKNDTINIKNAENIENTKDLGLSDIHKIINDARPYLLKGAYLLIEHGYDQGEWVPKLLLQAGYQGAVCEKDLANNHRYSYGCCLFSTANPNK